MDIEKIKDIHFIGIGGKGMSGLALVCREYGLNVSGSDIDKTDELEHLKEKGIKIFYNQSQLNIKKGIGCVVTTHVIKNDNPEITQAKKFDIPIVERSMFMGIFFRNFLKKEIVSVAGSHGKSTTSSLLSLVLEKNKENPSFIVGAKIKEFKSSSKLGSGKYAVIESCEYKNSFFNLFGRIAIITSLEKNHIEYFKNEDNMNKSFLKFLKICKENDGSFCIIDSDNGKLRSMADDSQLKTIGVGFDIRSNYRISGFKEDKNGISFNVINNKQIYNFKSLLTGKYNAKNITYVFALLKELNMDLSGLHKVLKKFDGIHRRFEIRKTRTKILIDDFAHHPSQVKNLICSIKTRYKERKLTAIFQPRQFNLVKTFLEEYGESFLGANEVIVTPIISALMDTEVDKKSVSPGEIINSIINKSKPDKVLFFKNKKDISKYLNLTNQNGVIATIGAGNINMILDDLIIS